MEYRLFGNTGINLSRLGFGTMRPPSIMVDGKEAVDEEIFIPMLHRAFEQGVNYVDSAYFYGWFKSDAIVGKALKGGWRDKVYVSTKYPFNGDFRTILDEQLRNLDTYIDFYHFHGIGESFFTHARHEEAINGALKAKEEGLIKHLSFSFHDETPQSLFKIVDMGIFSSVLCQYNLLDRSNEAGLAYAKSRGLGTAVMGPVAGGRLAGMTPEVAQRFGVQTKSSVELALRFVLANPNVDVAVSGMGSMAMLDENLAIASNTAPLSAEEVAGIAAATEENKRLAELYCTGCKYCLPYCPRNVSIHQIFQAMNYRRVWGLAEFAQQHYNGITPDGWAKGHKADACVECGACEEHCPQKIRIREQLKECQEVFGGVVVA